MSDAMEVYLEMMDGNNSSFVGRHLKVDTIRFDVSRQPIVITVPKGNGSSGPNYNSPQSYVLDYGMMTEMVSLDGICIDNEPDVYAGPAHPGVASLGYIQQVVRGGWFGIGPGHVSGGGIGIRGGVRAAISMGTGQGRGIRADSSGTDDGFQDRQFYQGAVIAFRASRTAGVPQWTWSMQIQVGAWPMFPYPMAPQ